MTVVSKNIASHRLLQQPGTHRCGHSRSFPVSNLGGDGSCDPAPARHPCSSLAGESPHCRPRSWCPLKSPHRGENCCAWRAAVCCTTLGTSLPRAAAMGPPSAASEAVRRYAGTATVCSSAVARKGTFFWLVGQDVPQRRQDNGGAAECGRASQWRRD